MTGIKIKSRRELATELYNNGKVELDRISKKLDGCVRTWEKAKDVRKVHGFLILI